MILLILTIGVMCHGTIAYDYYKYAIEEDEVLDGWGFLLMLVGVVFFWVNMVMMLFV